MGRHIFTIIKRCSHSHSSYASHSVAPRHLPPPLLILLLSQLKHELELETFSLNFLIEDLNTRVSDLENDLQDDLRKEFEEGIEIKGSDLQVKLEDFIENKLEDVEEVVKQDVRIALGNAKYDFSIEF
jgi:hypothetical protein